MIDPDFQMEMHRQNQRRFEVIEKEAEANSDKTLLRRTV